MMRARYLILLAVAGLLTTGEHLRAQRQGPKHLDKHMSPMGRGAERRARARALAFLQEKGLVDLPDDSEDDMDAEPVDCDDNGCDTGGGEEFDNPNAAQSELSVAIDASGGHIVIGFNDFRGFNTPATVPLSISGFAYSDDGGATFVDGGQLPVVSNGQLAGTAFPEVSGDPDVKYVPGGGGCQFIYSSIFVKGIGTGTPPSTFAGTAQTMSIHRSTDCGHTWTGPFEVTAATNPHGVLSGPNARDAADKEFLDVDPDTGRVIMSWSNFSTAALTGISPAGVEIRTTFSDNIMSATPPTWSAGVVLNPGSTTFDTGSIPRFAGGGSPNVYVAWQTQNLSTGNTNARVARSTNNGGAFSPSVKLNASDVPLIDYILGNDRVHSFPGLAVGPEGNVYVVYAHNGNHDGSDIAFHRSTDGGVTFSPAVLINARPGQDRAQWFPYAAADASNGRVYVSYYDQGVATSGDITQIVYAFSDDGGATWSAPAPLMSTGCRGIATDPLDCRSFHAGYGNDTSQPNLGDYIGATSRNGVLYAVWAASPRVVGFADGQPTQFFNAPDFYVNTVHLGLPPIGIGTRSFVDSGGNGFVDPGDQLSLTLPLFNYVTNPVDGASTLSAVSGTLSTSTPAVSIVSGVSSYANIAPGATATNATPYVVQVDQAFTPGTPIEFALTISTAVGSKVVLFTQLTGTPVPTTIFSENFNGVAAGTLPAGWTTIHAGGANTVPWTTNSAFCGTSSNGLFHANANDGVGGTGNPTRFERVASPNITIPPSGEYVTLDFDICYDTEDDPGFNVLAYDGALLRITDFTTGRFARANLVEAFAESIATGSIAHYPKHNPRSSSTSYFQDMSMWSGVSNGFQHVRMRLPGMAGSVIQLRPDYTQDSVGTCADVRPGHACGVMIDNIVLRSVVSATTVTTATTIVSSQNPSDLGAPVTFTATVTAGSPVTTGTVTFREGATVLAAGVAVNGSGQASFTTSALTSGSHPISATYDGTPHFLTSSASLNQLVDVQPSIAIDDVSVTEGNAGTATAIFTVSLSAPTNAVTASVSFATADGSATAGSDYQSTGGTLSFPPGTTTRTISVLVNGDFVIEPNETFRVNLSGVSNATIADGQGVGTIVNDDTIASTLAALVAQVGACSGGLNDGQCQSLLTRLAAAQRDLSDGRADKVIRDLQQFVDDVQRFSRSIPGDGNPPRLDPATAAIWTEEAQSVMAAVSP
jgi:Bacterial Ig-like domain (group 3)